MCISLSPAKLSDTIILAHSFMRPGLGPINVLGYQNTATTRGPNAMLLPIPSAVAMSAANCLDMTDAPELLKKYQELVVRRARGGNNRLSKSMSFSVEEFDSGSYRVLLAPRAAAIPTDR